jgi:hypothetical protein
MQAESNSNIMDNFDSNTETKLTLTPNTNIRYIIEDENEDDSRYSLIEFNSNNVPYKIVNKSNSYEYEKINFNDNLIYKLYNEIDGICYYYEPYSNYYSNNKIMFIKNLIKVENFNYIAFRNYDDNIKRFISVKLNNNNRIMNYECDITKISQSKNYLKQLFKWLYHNLWTKYCIHGDLTTNNILIDFNENTISVIDWADTLFIATTNHKCHLYFYILIDIYDLINTFAVTVLKNNCHEFDELLRLLHYIKEFEYFIINYYNVDSSVLEKKCYICICKYASFFKCINYMIESIFDINFIMFGKYIEFDFM